MKTTREEKKTKAIEFLQQLNILEEYIEDFKKNDTVCLFERFGGYWLYQYPELQAKQKEIEEKYNCIVYAVTHEFVNSDDCYSFLLVTNYKQEWSLLLESEGKQHTAFAYVWNTVDDSCSEFGSVGIQSFGGGIRRFA